MTKLASEASRKRATAGNSVVELPICLSLLFLMFFLPLTNLTMIGMRAFAVFSAARSAASVAGRSFSFAENSAQDKPSAKHVAPGAAILAAQACPAGARLKHNQVKVFLIAIPIKPGGASIKQDYPLVVVDTDNYVYQIEVSVSAEVEPLVRLNSNVFGEVPGLTRPFWVQASCREFAEHPSGLSR